MITVAVGIIVGDEVGDVVGLNDGIAVVEDEGFSA